METHRSRLDEILNVAICSFEEPFKEKEIVLVWDKKSFDEAGENSSNTTRFRVVPANIRDRSLEEQVAFVSWSLLGQLQQKALSRKEYLKSVGEALYRAWMQSGEDVANFSTGPHRMLTDTLPALIRNHGFTSLTELVEEALTAELDATAKSKVVSEVVRKGLVSHLEELYTLEGPSLFVNVISAEGEQLLEDVESANVHNVRQVTEFVRRYVPAEIEQSYVPLDQFLETVATRLTAKDRKKQIASGALETRLKEKGLMIELDTVFGVRKYLPKERTLEADVVAYGWFEVLLHLRQEGDYANAKKTIQHIPSSDSAKYSAKVAVIVESCGIRQALRQSPSRQEKGSVMDKFNAAFDSYYGVVQRLERIPKEVRAIISEDLEFIREFTRRTDQVFGRSYNDSNLRRKANLLKEAVYAKPSTVMAAAGKTVQKLFRTGG